MRCSSLRGPLLRQKSGGGRKGGSAINSLIVRFNLVPECAVFLALLEERRRGNERNARHVECVGEEEKCL